MKFLVLGDIFPSAIPLLKKKIPYLIKKNKIDFIIANGENSAKDGQGITEATAKNLFKLGVDVLTSGNHIWDKKEILKYITHEKRLLRPANVSETLPGHGYNIFKKSGKRICVINLMTNYFMQKSSNIFSVAKMIIKKINLKKNVDYIIVDVHGEFAGEKMAIGHLYDGKVTLVFGSHTHIPSSDGMILSKGTAYQTDLGMCGDYNSIIGLEKNIFLKKFLKITSKSNRVAFGKPTICGSIIKANNKTGLAKSIKQVIIGGKLNSKNS